MNTWFTTWIGLAASAASVDVAEPIQNVELRFSAPPGCPDQGQVEAELARLGPTMTDPAATSVDGTIAPTADGYVLTLQIDFGDRIEQRRVEANDCAVLGRAAALVVAVTLDAVGVSGRLPEFETAVSPPATQSGRSPAPSGRRPPQSGRPPQPNPPPPSGRPPPPSSGEGAPSMPSLSGDPGPAASPRLNWTHGGEVSVSGGLGVAVVPAVTGGIEGEVGWRYGPVRVQVLAFHWFGQTARATPDAGVFTELSGGGLRGCYALSVPKRFEIPACIGVDLAAMRGRGRGATVTPAPIADLWVAATGSVGFHVRIGAHFAVQTKAELSVVLRRPALHLEQGGEPGGEPIDAFRAPRLGFRLGLGPLVHF